MAARPATSSSRVDLPTPGSPLSRIAEPGTTPPPQTRSNSVTPVTIRGGSGVSDCRVSNWTPRVRAVFVGFIAPGGAERLSSTMEFHWPQAPHWPDHLPWTAPQDWQT